MAKTERKHPLRHEPETERQRAWTKAAEQEEHKGNDFAAAFFFLLGQPSEHENRDRR